MNWRAYLVLHLQGKKYWADGARIHDVYEAQDGLRFRPLKEKKEKVVVTDENSTVARKDSKMAAAGSHATTNVADAEEKGGDIAKKSETH